MSALVTDLYQLTMAAGFFAAGKTGEEATFELFVRRLPRDRNYIVAAGLAQAVEYLLSLRFTEADVAYLKSLRQFRGVSQEFFDYLLSLRFTGDLFAVPEGTPLFAGEPILTVRAPLVEAQIPETFLLATIGFQTMIATKASRVAWVAGQHNVVDFGTRRAHSPEAGVLAGRAAYIGGCIGTSNTETGARFGVPVFGTAAHSWVMSFPSELEAFRQLQTMLGESTVYLIDSYDTIEGARRAASLGKPLWGVRLDSGNLFKLAPAVRKILDEAGLPDAKIMATGDLNEYKIAELVAKGVPIDAFGVGTDLVTSSDSPSMGVVYKLVELEQDGIKRYTAKFSAEKSTMPGAKQVFRYADHDQIAMASECPSCPKGSLPAVALQRPVILGGHLMEPLPDVHVARKHAAESLAKLPAACHSLFEREDCWHVEYSNDLKSLAERVRASVQESGT